MELGEWSIVQYLYKLQFHVFCYFTYSIDGSPPKCPPPLAHLNLTLPAQKGHRRCCRTHLHFLLTHHYQYLVVGPATQGCSRGSPLSVRMNRFFCIVSIRWLVCNLHFRTPFLSCRRARWPCLSLRSGRTVPFTSMTFRRTTFTHYRTYRRGRIHAPVLN